MTEEETEAILGRTDRYAFAGQGWHTKGWQGDGFWILVHFREEGAKAYVEEGAIMRGDGSLWETFPEGGLLSRLRRYLSL